MNFYILMPFNDIDKITYKYAISAAIKELSEKCNIKFNINRADDFASSESNKQQVIMKSIWESDVMIVDFSGNNPNIMWELGYCDALDKICILISKKLADGEMEKIPFYIRNRDQIRYEFSADGLETLKRRLQESIKSQFEKIYCQAKSLRFNPEIREKTARMDHVLSNIESNSLLATFVKNEFEQVYENISTLNKGRFTARSVIPRIDVAKRFCSYIRNQKGENSSFDTITYYNFWYEITDGGNNSNFTRVNASAAAKGVKIRRIFVIQDGPEKAQELNKFNALVRILNKYLEITKGYENIETKIFKSKDYRADRETYKNFGLVKEGNEMLLLKPMYISEKGYVGEFERLAYTEGLYYKSDDPRYNDNLTEIADYENRFSQLWSKGEKFIEMSQLRL